MIVTLDGKKVKKVKDRTEGVLFILKQRKHAGQKWEVRTNNKVIFKWYVEVLIGNNAGG